MGFLKQCLQEPEGKTSIKRIMLLVWFIVLVGMAIFSELTMLQLYVFFGLLSGKTLESITQYTSQK